MSARLSATTLVAALVCLAGPLAGQTTPREAAAGFLDAWNARRWTDAAGFLDVAEFDRFRRDFLTHATNRDGDSRIPTVDEIRRREPDMPREVAEYQVRMLEEQQRRYADPTPWEFARVRDAAALRSLAPAEAAARWLESRDPRWQVEMQFREAGCAVPRDVEDVATATRRLVGTIPDGDATAYAVYKDEWPADAGVPDNVGGDLHVIELRLQRGRWVVVPRVDLLPEIGSVDVGECDRGPRRP